MAEKLREAAARGDVARVARLLDEDIKPLPDEVSLLLRFFLYHRPDLIFLSYCRDEAVAANDLEVTLIELHNMKDTENRPCYKRCCLNLSENLLSSSCDK